MIVCLIAEGCYPYITGGVSGWMHQLITGLPHIDFKILSVMPNRTEKLSSKYPIPANVLEVKTIFMDDYLGLPQAKAKPIRIPERYQASLVDLVHGNSATLWPQIVESVAQTKVTGNAVEFLQSEFFWKSVLELYQQKCPDESFNNFFWTLRTMYLPFVHLIQQEFPEADIYHAVSTGYAGILGASCKVKTGKPLLLTEHGIYAREREEEILKAKWVTGLYKQMWINFFYFMSQIAYREANQIIALFERNQKIQIELGASPQQTRIVPNGIDYQLYRPAQRQSTDSYQVGAVLRVVPIKDVMTLIRAFKIVKQALPQATLHLVGPTKEDREYLQQCQNLITILKLEADVIFTGSVKVAEYLKRLDVLVLTSISEGQPLVILEGMAAGLPIVATDVGACRELLAENEYEGACGLVTGLVAPNETAVQIIRLLEDAELRESMGANGRQRVIRAYSQERLLNSYEEIYQSLG